MCIVGCFWIVVGHCLSKIVCVGFFGSHVLCKVLRLVEVKLHWLGDLFCLLSVVLYAEGVLVGLVCFLVCIVSLLVCGYGKS